MCSFYKKWINELLNTLFKIEVKIFNQNDNIRDITNNVSRNRLLENSIINESEKKVKNNDKIKSNSIKTSRFWKDSRMLNENEKSREKDKKCSIDIEKENTWKSSVKFASFLTFWKKMWGSHMLIYLANLISQLCDIERLIEKLKIVENCHFAIKLF